MGSLLFVLLLAVGCVGLTLMLVERERPLARRVAKSGFIGAGALLGVYLLVSVVTNLFD